MESLPQRPQPPRPLAEIVRAWLQWFGLIRLLVVAFAVVAVGAGAFWLLRAPATAVEDTLPIAARSTDSTTTTLGTNASGGGAAVAAPGATSTATTTSTASPTSIVVDVAGAVAAPGVYEFTPNARVHEAIAAAGGLAGDADTESINLAAVLRDGDRLYVPRLGQPVPTVVTPQGGAVAAAASDAADVSAPASPIDLNRATVDDLDQLPGVGPSTAAAIVAYREQHGPYATPDDLLKVRGIGPAKLDAIRALVTT